LESAFQKLVNGDAVMQFWANKICLQNKSYTDIENLGTQVMTMMFGGNTTSSLAALRYGMFTKKVVSAKSFCVS
jgi:hypothetical protein